MCSCSDENEYAARNVHFGRLAVDWRHEDFVILLQRAKEVWPAYSPSKGYTSHRLPDFQFRFCCPNHLLAAS